MRYTSTRGQSEGVGFDTVLVDGLAPDGGLYVPQTIPTLPDDWQTLSYEESVATSLELFGASNVRDLVVSAAARFNHTDIAPIVEVGDRLVLELFWGPTLSFKDHALQVVTRLLDREIDRGTILGATSGDTGSAAIEAVRGSTSLDIVILFPEGKVSEFQRRQMTTVTEANVTAVAVRGTFDDCQTLVKEAFSRHDLLAINSINWARVAAQVGYYIYAAATIGEPFDVVVPTGNFGNAYSCWVAKQMGLPIETITVSNNANHRLFDLITNGATEGSDVTATIAPSMDIQVPSNLERFAADPVIEFEAGWSDDEQIKETILDVYSNDGYLLDTHTATAWRAGDACRSDRPQLVVATAHPVKFADAVTDAIGVSPDLPPGYPDQSLLPERVVSIGNDPSALEPLIR